MAKVTGIGGVFFKAKSDKAALARWYEEHLGMKLEPFGAAILRWTDDHASDGGATVWMPADHDTTWFAPSTSDFMINYRVDDLVGLLAQLAATGILPVQGPTTEENGSFAWIVDPDGNKLELWEPKD